MGAVKPITGHVHISRLVPHPANIREGLGDLTDLTASIRAAGIIQPLVVEPRSDGKFAVIAGHRRLAAAKLARLDTVPVVHRQTSGDDAHVTELMLIENCQRADLDPIEKAKAMGKLRDSGRTVISIAKAIGLTGATVHQYLALLELDAESQQRVRDHEISVHTAYKAVVKARATQRRRSGQKPRGDAMRVTWEPDHFTAGHALARQARAMCDAREHNYRRRLGKVACGQCWETVIRADERVASAALEAGS